MQSSAAEYFSDLDFTERWAKDSEQLHGITHEYWKLINRLVDLYERVGPLFVDAASELTPPN